MTAEDIKTGLKNNSSALRWFVLILVSITIGTNYYVYDAFSSIKSIMQAELNFSNSEYGWVVGMYSFLNTFALMAVFGGIILDKWGIRKTGFMFVFLCVLGALATAYGASEVYRNDGPLYSFMGTFLPDYSPEFKMMILGRMLFGLGAETSIIVITKVVVKWFKGKELALALGVNLAIARLGTAGALIFSPTFVESSSGWTSALWFAAVLMGVGLLFFIFYMFFDAREDRKDESLLEPDEEFHFSDIGLILKNRSFLFIIILCVTFYSAVFPFQAYVPDFLHNKFGVTLETSGMLSSLIIWGTIVFTPLFGLLTDKKGKRASLMLLGSFLLLTAHLTLALTYITPYIAMFMLGIAFSLVPAAMWPSVALIIDEKRLGTAYGLMTSLQNLGLWGFPILAGVILDISNPQATQAMLESGKATLDYTYAGLMFATLGIIGFIFAYLLKRENSKTKAFNLEKP